MNNFRHILLSPTHGGWRVDSATRGASLMFLSGADAEAYACRLAIACAGLGGATDIRRVDERGETVTLMSYAPRGGA